MGGDRWRGWPRTSSPVPSLFAAATSLSRRSLSLKRVESSWTVCAICSSCEPEKDGSRALRADRARAASRA